MSATTVAQYNKTDRDPLTGEVRYEGIRNYYLAKIGE